MRNEYSFLGPNLCIFDSYIWNVKHYPLVAIIFFEAMKKQTFTKLQHFQWGMNSYILKHKQFISIGFVSLRWPVDFVSIDVK